MFVGPMSFSHDLVKWLLSGSKAVHTLDQGTTASGSIYTLHNLLKDMSKVMTLTFCR